MNMQAEYPKKLPTVNWDTLNINYPVRKFPETGLSSKTIGHRWQEQAEVLKPVKSPVPELKDYLRDYNVTNELTRSQTTVDFGYKHPETKRFNKHTSCTENHYVYPPSRRLAERPPACTAHGTSEMRNSYTPPEYGPRLVTDKDQFKHPASLPPDPDFVEPSWHKDVEPLDTTHDGYEKYLDPYLTTNRLHHRPYTADQLNRQSNSKDIVTYYTLADTTWVRTPRPVIEDWRLPLRRPKSMYDREKFKEDFREIRTHNKLHWVPGSFRTESRDNYKAHPEIANYEELVRTHYQRMAANLSTNSQFEHSTIRSMYSTENAQTGSRKPLCSVLDQHIEKNKRLDMKSMRREKST